VVANLFEKSLCTVKTNFPTSQTFLGTLTVVSSPDLYSIFEEEKKCATAKNGNTHIVSVRKMTIGALPTI
jgi:hypothetical protein